MTALRIDGRMGSEGQDRPGLRGWMPALALIAVFAVIGGYAGGLGWPLFVVGCIAVSILTWRKGIASHFRASLVLFAFALFIRRIIDNGAGDRLATLGQGSQDSSLMGNGFTITDVGSAGQMPIDGMNISSWMTMGIAGGILCLCSSVWAISGAVVGAVMERSRQAVMIGAMAMGGLLQMTLANITAAKAGFLFWSFVVLTPGIRAHSGPKP